MGFSVYSKKMIIFTLLAGLIYGIVANVFYEILYDVIPSILLTFIYFGGLFCVVGITVQSVSQLVYSQYRGRIHMKAWLISIVLIIILSLLFEFLYDIIQERKGVKEADSYLFVIDDSGSMETTDPNNLRYEAIKKLLDNKDSDFRYGIYSFSDSVSVIRPMAEKGDSVPNIAPNNFGGTSMKHALNTIMDDLDSGELKIDDGTRVIMLTDGSPTDVLFRSGLMKPLRRFEKNNITISTVGLLYANDNFMNFIADKTGGVYVRCDNLSQLEDSLNQAAINNNTYRNLLNYRSGSFLTVLLGLMRILFIIILGEVIAVQKAAICDKFIDTKSVFYSSAVCGVISGFLIEIGMNAIGFNPGLTRIIMCIILSFTLLREDRFIQMHSRNDFKQSANTSW